MCAEEVYVVVEIVIALVSPLNTSNLHDDEIVVDVRKWVVDTSSVIAMMLL